MLAAAAAGRPSTKCIAAKLPRKRFIQRSFALMRAPPAAPLDYRKRLLIMRFQSAVPSPRQLPTNEDCEVSRPGETLEYQLDHRRQS